jgi:hypothetical protein
MVRYQLNNRISSIKKKVDISSHNGNLSSAGRLSSVGTSQPARSRLYKGKRSERESSLGSIYDQRRHTNESEEEYMKRIIKPVEAKSKEDIVRGRNMLASTTGYASSYKNVGSTRKVQ